MGRRWEFPVTAKVRAGNCYSTSFSTPTYLCLCITLFCMCVRVRVRVRVGEREKECGWWLCVVGAGGCAGGCMCVVFLCCVSNFQYCGFYLKYNFDQLRRTVITTCQDHVSTLEDG